MGAFFRPGRVGFNSGAKKLAQRYWASL